MRRMLTMLPVLGVAAVLTQALVSAQDGAALFADNCAPCHNIGEAGGVGPDLRDVGGRRERAWLLSFVMDPASVNKAAGMPQPQGLDRAGVAAILDYIDSRSATVPAAPAASAPAAPVFTAADVARGRAIYSGTTRLANGGPACLSCHDAGLDTGLGGGTLGPNLARLATRLSGPKGTSAWLSSPPTAVMRSVFSARPLVSTEVHALTAFFVDRVRPDEPPVPTRTRRFAALGVAGAAVGFVLIGTAWRGRLRPVRRGLVNRAARYRGPKATHTHGFRSGGPR